MTQEATVKTGDNITKIFRTTKGYTKMPQLIQYLKELPKHLNGVASAFSKASVLTPLGSYMPYWACPVLSRSHPARDIDPSH